MSWTDIVIIYFAFGAPFCVYRIVQNDAAFTASGAAKYAVTFVAWPVVAVIFVLSRFLPGEKARVRFLNARVERVRAEIENLGFTDSSKSLFEFRDIYYRYTGLAITGLKRANPSKEIFKISGHPNADLAAKCLARRNREKLVFHQVQARNEFIDLIARMTAMHERGDEVIQVGRALAVDLGDVDAAADLNALVPAKFTKSSRVVRRVSTAAVR